MHVLQYIAVQEDSKENAHATVNQFLETQLGSDPYTATNAWYDWFVVGGGRWSDNPDPYDNTYTGEVVHQDDPKFHEYLIQAHKFKLKSTSYWLSRVSQENPNIEGILDDIENKQEGLYPLFEEAWQLSSLVMLHRSISGEWTPHSYFFDMVNEITYPKVVKESIESGVDNWYLVPVDFHY